MKLGIPKGNPLVVGSVKIRQKSLRYFSNLIEWNYCEEEKANYLGWFWSWSFWMEVQMEPHLRGSVETCITIRIVIKQIAVTGCQ